MTAIGSYVEVHPEVFEIVIVFGREVAGQLKVIRGGAFAVPIPNAVEVPNAGTTSRKHKKVAGGGYRKRLLFKVA